MNKMLSRLPSLSHKLVGVLLTTSLLLMTGISIAVADDGGSSASQTLAKLISHPSRQLLRV